MSKTYDSPVIVEAEFASHKGVPIFRDSHNNYGFHDKDGNQHIRNTRLTPRKRMEWVRHDIDWYLEQGWVAPSLPAAR